MAELVARVDPRTGDVIGEVDKDVAHRDGVWHATIHVWVLDDLGRVLLQQRSFAKPHFAGMWDISAAGHIGAGETGVREVAEELGVDVELDDLEFAGVWVIDHADGDVVNRERPRVYLWRSGRSADAFEFADGEVIGLAAMTVAELADLVAGDALDTVAWRGSGFESVTVTSEDLVPLGAQYWAQLLSVLAAS